MGYLSVVPAPPLACQVESIRDWEMPRAAHEHERMLPSAKAHLVINPFGHGWTLSTRIEDLDAAEVVRRFEALLARSPQDQPEKSS